jgi:hypothetical protein
MADKDRNYNPGIVRCLGGCDKEFHSRDKSTNRICPSCSKDIDKKRAPRTISSKIATDNGQINLEGDK